MSGTGFMHTQSSEDSLYRVKELLDLGFISNYAIIDAGFFFIYTDKGREFAKNVHDEAKAIGLSSDEYVGVFMNLQRKGEVNGEEGVDN